MILYTLLFDFFEMTNSLIEIEINKNILKNLRSGWEVRCPDRPTDDWNYPYRCQDPIQLRGTGGSCFVSCE